MTKLQQLAALCAKVDHLKGIEQSYHTDAVYEAAEQIAVLQAQVTPLVSSVFDLISINAALVARVAALEANTPQAQQLQAEPEEAAADDAMWLFDDGFSPCLECQGTGTQIGVAGKLPCIYCLGTGDAS